MERKVAICLIALAVMLGLGWDLFDHYFFADYYLWTTEIVWMFVNKIGWPLIAIATIILYGVIRAGFPQLSRREVILVMFAGIGVGHLFYAW